MRRQMNYCLLGAFLLMLPNTAMPQTADIKTIHQRIVTELMKAPVDAAEIENLIKSLRSDGTWPGIDYQDVSRTGFEHRHHTGNMVKLARAWNSRSTKHHRSRNVKNAIELALKNWVDNDYFCDNWWHNQIGTPDNLVSLMLIIGAELTKELVDKAQPMIGRAHLTASGARPSGDRIKIAGILAKNLLFVGDYKQFDDVIKVIEGEIKFTTGFRGLQHDYSFHHRDDRVNNTLSYGLGYVDAFAEWAVYVTGTRYAFSEEKIGHLIDYYLDGICKQMVYGKTGDPGTKNRDISRLSGRSAFGTSTPERLMQTSTYRKTELEEIVKIRKGTSTPSLSFGKFFWQTEHYSHQRPNYFTSVRMFSTRNRNMEEPYNSEGLLNHHRADGTNHISLKGDEYLNIAPVYDWQKIPGTTVLQKPELPSENQIQKSGLTNFVGAVTDGLYGAAVFDFKSPHDPLEAKKAWFFFDEEYVCLGAGINARSPLPVATTLNQCLLEGDVVAMGGSQKSTLSKGERELENIKWVFHNGIGYLFPEPVKVQLSNQSEKGSWFKINQQSSTSKEEVSMDVFKLWLNHGTRVQNGSYQYIVVPGTTVGELEKSKENRGIEILVNTPEIQAVKHVGLNILQAVFYTAGEIKDSDGLKLVMDSPGQVMVQTDGRSIKKITVSDPSRNLRRIHFSVNSRIEKSGDNFKSIWNEKEKVSEISVQLPQLVYAGQSVTIELIVN
jgi:chondroitin AC lyase